MTCLASARNPELTGNQELRHRRRGIEVAGVRTTRGGLVRSCFGRLTW